MAASTSSAKDDDRHVNADAEVGVANDVVPIEDAEIVFDAAAIEVRTWLLDFINNVGDSLPVVAKKLMTELHNCYHLKLGFVWKKLYCPHCNKYFTVAGDYISHSLAHKRAAERQADLIEAGRASFW